MRTPEEKALRKKERQKIAVKKYRSSEKGKLKEREYAKAYRSTIEYRERASKVHLQWTRDNLQKAKEIDARSRKKRRPQAVAVTKEWALKNPEKAKVQRQRAYLKNKIKKVAAVRARQVSKLKATPAWANKKQVEEFYETSLGLSMIFGEWYHVDHIVPLRGKNVCGLHCEFNLRVILGKHNLQKGNRLLEGASC